MRFRQNETARHHFLLYVEVVGNEADDNHDDSKYADDVEQHLFKQLAALGIQQNAVFHALRLILLVMMMVVMAAVV